MLDQVQASPRNEDWGLNKVCNWELKLCWRPQTCFLTGKRLWGKYAYHGTRLINGPGIPLEDHYWVDKLEFVIWQIKK